MATEDAGDRQQPLALVRWRYPDGREGTGSPLPAEIARELMQLYAARYPERHYWIVEVESAPIN